MSFLSNLFRSNKPPKLIRSLGYDPPFSHDGFYSYNPTPYPHPGTGNLALMQRVPNPSNMIQGFGILGPCNGALLATEPNPLFLQPASVPFGFGPEAGNVYLSPLLDPNMDPNG